MINMSVLKVYTWKSDDNSDVVRAVKALIDASQHLQNDAGILGVIDTLIGRLKLLLVKEQQMYAHKHHVSDLRGRIQSLQKLIKSLDMQLQRARKAAHRRGLQYCLTRISNAVLGDEMGRIRQSMESELQSWLDRQGVRDLARILGNDSEDKQVQAISSFEAALRKGYDSQLQDTILTSGIVEKLASLLTPNAAPWRVQKEAAFALAALPEFNKDVFLSLVLMAEVVKNILSLMSNESDEHILYLVCVLKCLLSAGRIVIADEISGNDGVQNVVNFLDHKYQPLQHVAMDCIFELVYYGRIELIQTLLELDVVKKLARLQCLNGAAYSEKAAKQRMDCNSLPLDTDRPRALIQDGHTGQPFASAVTKLALHLAIGTGLRKREKSALKRDLLRQIKDVFQDDAEVGNIIAEVLWTP